MLFDKKNKFTNEINVKTINNRLADHKKRLIELINDNPFGLMQTVNGYEFIFKQINSDFSQYKINFAAADIDSIPVLVYELRLILHLLEYESRLNKNEFNELYIDVKNLLNEVYSFKKNVENFILPALNEFNPLELTDETEQSILIKGELI